MRGVSSAVVALTFLLFMCGVSSAVVALTSVIIYVRNLIGCGGSNILLYMGRVSSTVVAVSSCDICRELLGLAFN